MRFRFKQTLRMRPTRPPLTYLLLSNISIPVHILIGYLPQSITNKSRHICTGPCRSVRLSSRVCVTAFCAATLSCREVTPHSVPLTYIGAYPASSCCPCSISGLIASLQKCQLVMLLSSHAEALRWWDVVHISFLCSEMRTALSCSR